MTRSKGAPELSQFERGRIVGMLEAGMSQAEVSRKVNRSRYAVQCAWKRWLETSANANLPRSGRPRITTPRNDRQLMNVIRSNRMATYTRISAMLATPLSRRMVNNRALEGGFRSRRPLLRIPLSPKNRRTRYEWCMELQKKEIGYWNKIVFSDESRFTLDVNDGRVRVHRQISERYLESCISEHDSHGRGGIMVWGAIRIGYRSRLLIIKGNINALRYISDILEPEAIGFIRGEPGLLYMQDNARPHVATVTMQHLKSAGVDLLSWPARSPDLNPIEHLWDILGRRLSSAYEFPPATLHQLQNRLIEQWDLINTEEIDKLILSMPNRLSECVTKKGGHTHY